MPKLGCVQTELSRHGLVLHVSYMTLKFMHPTQHGCCSQGPCTGLSSVKMCTFDTHVYIESYIDASTTRCCCLCHVLPAGPRGVMGEHNRLAGSLGFRVRVYGWFGPNPSPEPCLHTWQKQHVCSSY